MIDRKIIKRVEGGRESEYKPLEVYRDLGKAGVSGLKEHGIRPEQFNKMTPREQNEWAHELHTDAYRNMRKPHRVVRDKKFY